MIVNLHHEKWIDSCVWVLCHFLFWRWTSVKDKRQKFSPMDLHLSLNFERLIGFLIKTPKRGGSKNKHIITIEGENKPLILIGLCWCCSKINCSDDWDVVGGVRMMGCCRLTELLKVVHSDCRPGINKKKVKDKFLMRDKIILK